MKLNFLPYFLMISGAALGQIGYRSAASSETRKKAYDSLLNFKELGRNYNAASLPGQELYFVKRPPKFAPMNYNDTLYNEFVSVKAAAAAEKNNNTSEIKDRVKGRFSAFVPRVANTNALSEKKRTSTLYKPVFNDYSSSTPYSAIEGRSFKIISFSDSSLGDNQYLFIYKMILQDSDGEKIAWNLHSRQMPPFPVYIKGYLEKLKTVYLNKTMYYKVTEGATSQRYNTLDKKTYDLTPGSEWTCTEVTFLDAERRGFPELYLIFKNKTNMELAVSTSGERSNSPVISQFYTGEQYAAYKEKTQKEQDEKIAKQKADSVRIKTERAAYTQEMVKSYGKTNGELIANNQVRLGMTKDMCSSAWGSPTNTSSTKSVNSTIEIWYYGNNRWLSFVDNKLTQITD